MDLNCWAFDGQVVSGRLDLPDHRRATLVNGLDEWGQPVQQSVPALPLTA